MSQSIPVGRNNAYRFIFPLPPYCAYIGGALPVKSNDTRPATPTNAYPRLFVVPAIPRPYTPVSIPDETPRTIPPFKYPPPIRHF